MELARAHFRTTFDIDQLKSLFGNKAPFYNIYIILARTPEIEQGLGLILSCAARKQEQTWRDLRLL